jgi:excinuclease ABC subunit B
MTGSMERCIQETSRRRETQRQHNDAHGIVPRGVEKSVEQVRFITRVADAREGREEREREAKRVAERAASYGEEDRATMIERLEREMREAAANLDFETAARLRDQLFVLKAKSAGNVARSRGAFADIRAHT